MAQKKKPAKKASKPSNSKASKKPAAKKAAPEKNESSKKSVKKVKSPTSILSFGFGRSSI